MKHASPHKDFWIGGLLMLLSSSVSAQVITDEYRKDVGKLFEQIFNPKVVEAQKAMFVPAITAQLRAQNPQLTERAANILSSEFYAAFETAFRSPAQFGEVLAPQFAANFSQQEVKQLLDFYHSSLGQKWQGLIYDPKLMEQTFSVWLRAALPDICRRSNLRLSQEGSVALPSAICSQ